MPPTPQLRNQPIERRLLEYFTIYGHGSRLGHVTSIMLMNFYTIVPESLHKNLDENGPVISEKSKFQFA